MITLNVTKAAEGAGNADVSNINFALASREITGFKVLTGSRNDDGRARGRNLVAGMEITGVILSSFGDNVADDTVNLAEWANTPAESTAAYRNVLVELGTANQIERYYKLREAYVASYKEFFTEGNDGHFKMVLRQRRTGEAFKDMVEIKGAYGFGAK